MKKITHALLLSATITLSGATLAQATIIDAPHNESKDIICQTCHTYSLWWQYSPVEPTANYQPVVDNVCYDCHGMTGPEFYNMGHTSVTMGSGSWMTKCTDCHSPHYQKQLQWLPASPVFNDGTLADGVFLVEGRMDTIIDNGDGTTTFQFTEALAKPGWDNIAMWLDKSGNGNPGGLNLSLGYGNAVATFEVVDASMSSPLPAAPPATGAGSITVQTGSDPISGYGDYENSTFGLFYGQLLRDNIAGKSVKMFDGDEDLVDFSPAREGICQVCHTATDHYRADGTEPVAHFTAYCTSCHRIIEGFRPIASSHNTFIGRGTCAGCHDAATYPDVIRDVHNAGSTCTVCHDVNPPALYADYTTGSPARTIVPVNWPTGSSPVNNGTCDDCHGTNYFDFHLNKDNHSTQVIANEPNCTSACHYHAMDLVADPNNATVSQVHHNNCDACHDPLNGGTLRGSAAGKNGGADCLTCHPAIGVDFGNHANTIDHSGQVDQDPAGGYYVAARDITRPECVNCHNGSVWLSIHSTQTCGTCHIAPYGALYGNALRGPGSCSTCHIEAQYDTADPTLGHPVAP